MKFKITSTLFILLFIFTGILEASEQNSKSKRVNNKHNKNYVPITYTWEKSSKIVTVNQTLVVTVKLKALKDLKDIVITANPNPALKLISGNSQTTFDNWQSGETKTIQYSVLPLRTDKYELAVHCSVISDEERMGTVQVLEFSSSDFTKKKQENLEKSGNQEYTVLPGKTD